MNEKSRPIVWSISIVLMAVSLWILLFEGGKVVYETAEMQFYIAPWVQQLLIFIGLQILFFMGLVLEIIIKSRPVKRTKRDRL